MGAGSLILIFFVRFAITKTQRRHYYYYYYYYFYYYYYYMLDMASSSIMHIHY